MTKPVSLGLYYSTLFPNTAPIFPNLGTIEPSDEKRFKTALDHTSQQKYNSKVLSKQEKEVNSASATTKMNSGCSE